MYHPIIGHGCHCRAHRLGKHLPAVDPESPGVHVAADKAVFAIGTRYNNFDQLGQHVLAGHGETSAHYPDL
jgi:hypothetical protein